MTPKAYRSAWGLTILSLLKERPMHPYEMRRLIRERGKADLVELPPGSVYRTIDRLAASGLIEPSETSREGRFPERTVYRLTENGSEELDEWLRELLSQPLKDFAQFAAALSFLPVLTPNDVRAELERRVLRLEAEIAGYDTTEKPLRVALPRLFTVEIEYVRALRQTELEWVRALIDDLRTGRLTWDSDELRRLYGQPGQPLPALTVVHTETEGEQ